MDYGGLSCKIYEIKNIAEENNLVLIEDAAEALGSSAKGKKNGSISDCTIFSFCGNKVITTGEGGAIVTNSKEIYEKVRLFSSHGRTDNVRYFNNPDVSNYSQLGYNWRMSSITAALGISQLQKLDRIVEMRQKNAREISSKLSKFSQILLPCEPENYYHIYQMYTIQLSDKSTRDALHKHLSNKRIFSKIYFEPIHLTSFYKQKFGFKKGLLPVTEQISELVLTLPLYPNMTHEEKEYLTSSISEFFESN